MTMLRTFRVMLFAGFIGSARWSPRFVPTPYPFAFWLQRIQPYFAGSW